MVSAIGPLSDCPLLAADGEKRSFEIRHDRPFGGTSNHGNCLLNIGLRWGTTLPNQPRAGRNRFASLALLPKSVPRYRG